MHLHSLSSEQQGELKNLVYVIVLIVYRGLSLGTVSREKTAVLLDFVRLWPTPLSPIWTTFTTFSDVEIQDLKVSLGLKILYILYDIYNLKRNLKFTLLAFWRK